MKKKKKQYRLIDQINEDQIREKESKDLNIDQTVPEFTQEEIDKFTAYNEKVTEIDPLYGALKPLHRQVLLRLLVKDFNRKSDDVLSRSKVEKIPIASGVNDNIIYSDVPNPYPFTKKAVVVACANDYFKPGELVGLQDKLTIKFGSQDSGIITVSGAFIHPDYEEDYDNMPEDPEDQHYGYVIVSQDFINVKL
jgi:hypothetical protein